MRGGSARSIVCAILMVALSCAVAQVAWADATDEARQETQRAASAYNVGAFDEAAARYETAYRLVPDPALLFNLGQALRLAGHPERALIAYKAYLRTSEPDAPAREHAQKRVTELERRAQRTDDAPSDAAPPENDRFGNEVVDPFSSPAAVRPGSHVGEVSSALVVRPSKAPTVSLQSTHERIETRRWVPVIGAAVLTVAFAATAIGEGLSARAQFDSLERGCGKTIGGCPSSDVAALKSQAHAVNYLWIAAAACAAGTAATYHFFIAADGPRAQIAWRF